MRRRIAVRRGGEVRVVEALAVIDLGAHVVVAVEGAGGVVEPDRRLREVFEVAPDEHVDIGGGLELVGRPRRVVRRVPRAATGRARCGAREVREVVVVPVQRPRVRRDLHARPALLRAGRRVLVVGVDVRARVLAPQARAAVAVVVPRGRHRERGVGRRVRVAWEVVRVAGVVGEARAHERVAALGVDDDVERVALLAVGDHVPRQARAVVGRDPAQLRGLAGRERRRAAALGHARRERETAGGAPCLAQAGERGDARGGVGEPRAGHRPPGHGDQTPVLRHVRVEAGVVGLDPVEHLVVPEVGDAVRAHGRRDELQVGDVGVVEAEDVAVLAHVPKRDRLR